MTPSKSGAIWINRFPENPTEDYIARRVNVPARPIRDLGKHSPEIDARRLEAGLKQVYVPTSNVCQILQRMSNFGRAHAMENFPNTAGYVGGLYQDHLANSSPLPICFTGPAGVGKSELLKAYERLIGEFPPISIAGVEGIPNIGAWFMRVNERASINQLLSPILEPANHANRVETLSETGSKNRDLVKLLQLSRRRAHRDGVCIAFADEFQFRTQSQDATSLITKLLYQLWTIGPRLVFVSNYSLLHSLKKRPDQDRDRLLSNPIVLHPSAIGSRDWSKTLEELFRVGPEVFQLRNDQDSDALHHYSFGVNRRLVDLLVLAYRMQREKKSSTVKLADIEKAQKSADFSCHRETVNILTKQSITRRMERADLWCPFESLESNNVIQADAVIERFERRVQDDLLRSSLTPEERKVVQSVETPLRKGKRRDTVVQIGKPGPLTKFSLLNGDASFLKNL